MWQQMPDQQLADINNRHADLIREAASHRIAVRKHTHYDAHFTGLRLRLGSLLIVIGKSLCDEEALSHNPAH
jgi:hypothetical protein